MQQNLYDPQPCGRSGCGGMARHATSITTCAGIFVVPMCTRCFKAYLASVLRRIAAATSIVRAESRFAQWRASREAQADQHQPKLRKVRLEDETAQNFDKDQWMR